jgi:uncharacterized protein
LILFVIEKLITTLFISGTMNNEEVISKTIDFVKSELEGETTGHDWFHSERVWKIALRLAKEENADLFIVQMAALLHDVDDWKFNGGKDDSNEDKLNSWLSKVNVSEEESKQIIRIINGLAFKGEGHSSAMEAKEGMVVQDADRLDALGAIGIARAFASGQMFGQMLYDPSIKPLTGATKEEYKKQYTGERKNTTVNHFYEKLLLLKDLMNTETAKKMAEERTSYMEGFLKQFFEEWDVKD